MARDPVRIRRTAVAVAAALVSALAAGAAVWLVATILQAYQAELLDAEARYTERFVRVPVASRVLGAGTVLTGADLQLVELGEQYVPDTVIRSLDDLVGRTVVERMLPGELVRVERLAPPEAGQGLSALVPSGMRALSLDLAGDQQVSGFIEPGDGVDLLVTLPDDADLERATETRTLVQAARVMAVDEEISETVRGEEFRHPRVTVAVSPDLVERIAHALEVGEAKLTLRSAIDMTEAETHGAIVASILGREGQRMTVGEFRARFSDADVERMIEIVHGKDKVREQVIDPHLVRAVPDVTPVKPAPR